MNRATEQPPATSGFDPITTILTEFISQCEVARKIRGFVPEKYHSLVAGMKEATNAFTKCAEMRDKRRREELENENLDAMTRLLGNLKERIVDHLARGVGRAQRQISVLRDKHRAEGSTIDPSIVQKFEDYHRFTAGIGLTTPDNVQQAIAFHNDLYDSLEKADTAITTAKRDRIVRERTARERRAAVAPFLKRLDEMLALAT